MLARVEDVRKASSAPPQWATPARVWQVESSAAASRLVGVVLCAAFKRSRGGGSCRAEHHCARRQLIARGCAGLYQTV